MLKTAICGWSARGSSRHFTKTLLVMKLTFVLLTAACLNVSATGIAQQVSFSGKDVPIERVFSVIEKQTGYVFFYAEDLLSVAHPVSIRADKMPPLQFLELVFKDQPIKYVIENKTIILSRKKESSAYPLSNNIPPLSRLLTDNPVAPQDVNGVVKDSVGNPIEGATVTISSLNKIVLTNGKGEFVFRGVEPGVYVLEISYVGFVTYKRSISVTDSSPTVLNSIILYRANTALREIAVTVSTGYETLPKERATGSFSQPNKILYSARTAPDVISKLEGITTGLVFNRSANGSPKLQIRGQSTINADANPLIVVDNFPYDGDINNINPNDVENITILKDAAASSIWGARAGNGVIVITTKKGRYNQPFQVSFSSFFSVSEKPDLSYNKNFLPATHFIDLETNLFNQGFYNGDLTSLEHPPVSPVVEILDRVRRGEISEQEGAALIDPYRNLDVRNDLSKYFYQREINQQYALQVNGGSPVANYTMSVGYDRGKPVLTGNDNNRITTNFLSSFKPIPQLELSGGINYIQNDQRSNSIIGDLQTLGPNGRNLTPYTQFADPSGNPLPILRGYRDSFALTAADKGLLNWRYYPLVEKELADNSAIRKDTRLRAGVKFTIINGLSIEGNYQYQNGSTETTVYNDISSYYTRNLINRFSKVESGKVTKLNIPLGSILQNNSSSFQSDNFRAQVNFSKTFRLHSMNVIGGVEWRDVKGKLLNNNTIYGYNGNNDSYQIVDFSQTYTLYPGGSSAIRNNFNIEHSTNRFRSFFTNISYDYKDRYTLSLSGRIDQTNLFGVKTNDRQVPLWSAGFKWNLSKESFYNIAWLGDLQLRTTYGFSGNMINNGTAYTTAMYSLPFSALFPAQYSIQYPGNPELRWEKVGMFNVGLDFRLANNAVYGSLEYYHKNARDLIGSVPLPSSTGFGTATVNYGKMRGEGIDINFNIDIFKRRDWQWSTSLLFSYAADKITRYYEGVGLPTNFLEGKPVNALYANKWAGLDPLNGAPRGYDTLGQISTAYNLLDLAPARHKAYAGRLNPSCFGGWRNTISFRNLMLTANISYKFNYYFFRNSINYYGLYYGWNGHEDFLNRWQKPGDELRTNIPSAASLPADQFRDRFYEGSEALVTRADHIRLQDIIISYTFTKLSSAIPFRQIQLTLNASNVGILWRANDFAIDPDLVQAEYAPPRVFSASIKAGF